MPTRNGSAEWRGDLQGGSGTLKVGTSSYEGPYSFKSRFEEGEGTNPEELIGAAQAACYSMQLSAMLANDTPVVMAVTFVFACLVVLFNLIADILYGWLDPRITFR